MIRPSLNYDEHSVVAFADSRQAVEQYLETSTDRRDRFLVRTSSPDLFFKPHEYVVEDLFAQVSQAQRMDYMYSGGELTKRVYEKLLESGVEQALCVLVARVVHRVHKEMFKALTLSEKDFRDPRIVISADTGNDFLNKSLNPKWPQFLKENPNLTECKIPVGGVREEWGKISRNHRYRYLAAIRLEDVLWKLSQSKTLSRVWPSKKTMGSLAVVVGSYMLRHVCGYLFAGGYQIECTFNSFKVLRSAIKNPPEKNCEVLSESEVSSYLDLINHGLSEFFSKWFRPQLHIVGASMVREELARDLAVFQQCKKIWEPYLKRQHVDAVLTRSPVGPELIALVQVCRDLKTPVIAGQHGVSREIEETYHSCRSVMYENTLTDLFLAYNEESVKADMRSPFRFGDSLPVGLSADYSKVSNRKSLKKRSGVLYVSTALLSGNINMLKGGMTDIDRIRTERDFIDKVLGELEERVTFKNYHSGAARYTEDSYLRTQIAKYPGISFFDEPLELVDFPIKAFRLMIVCRATSTFAWCLLADIPTIVVDFPNESPFKKSILPALKDSVFYFSAADTDVFDRVLEMCVMSPKKLELAWQAKGNDRREFMSRYISSTEEVSMKSAARSVRKYLQRHEDETGLRRQIKSWN